MGLFGGSKKKKGARDADSDAGMNDTQTQNMGQSSTAL